MVRGRMYRRLYSLLPASTSDPHHVQKDTLVSLRAHCAPRAYGVRPTVNRVREWASERQSVQRP